MNVYERIKDATKPVWVVAECGSNHNGDFDTAKALIEAAAEAGADAVKFQSFLADELVRRDSPDYAMLKRLEMPREWYAPLKAHAKALGLTWFSTVSNETTLGWLEEVGCEVYKVGSPTITHLPLIRKAAEIGRPMIISMGMGGEAEARSACSAVGNERLVFLHCVSEYPAKSGDIQRLYDLNFTLAGYSYSRPLGYSDHTMGIGTAVGAVALGARVIEKHFTLDRNQDGPDHHFASEPAEFAAMVKAIRECEASLTPVTRPTAHPALRTLHAREDLAAGTVLERRHFKVLRPAEAGEGLAPSRLVETVGRTLSRDVGADEAITSEDVGR